MLSSKSIKSIIANNQEDEAILLLHKQKIRNKYKHLEDLSLSDIVKTNRQDQIIYYLQRIKNYKHKPNEKYQYEYFEHKPYSIFDVAIPKQSLRDFEANTSSRKQHSPFPMDVADFIVSFYLREASLIFDPFAGWGERNLVCKKHNKKYIGYDTSNEALNYALHTYQVLR